MTASADILNVVGESRHLPECDWGSPLMKAYSDILFGTGFPCQMCRALRACEQRTEEAWSAIAGRDQYAEGYAAALDAAREAVRHVLGPMDTDDPGQRDAALAAIDALRGDR